MKLIVGGVVCDVKSGALCVLYTITTGGMITLGGQGYKIKIKPCRHPVSPCLGGERAQSWGSRGTALTPPPIILA